MINIDKIKKLCECAVLTGYIKNKERTISLLLIADAESGKSELIELMSQYPKTYYTNDISYKGLVEDIIPKFEVYQIGHLLIPDFINPLSHRRASESLIPALNSLLAEGTKDLKFYGSSKVYSWKVKGGLITGITRQLFDKKIITWRDNGFLSRIIPISFKYSEVTKNKIHRSIMNNEYIIPEKITKNFKGLEINSFNVKIPERISEKIEILSEGILSLNKRYSLIRNLENGAFQRYNLELSNYGFRLHKQLRTFIQGIALYNFKNPTPKQKIIVSEKDFKDLQELTKFMNFEFTKV